jgi:hypothetical protein
MSANRLVISVPVSDLTLTNGSTPQLENGEDATRIRSV